MDEEKRYLELKKILDKHSCQYYLLDDPEISDCEYDRLYNELLEIEKKFPELKSKNSPSQKVGAKASDKFHKVAHSTEMLSLDNAYNEDDITSFFERVKRLSGLDNVEFVLEPKFDGLSVSICYRNGILINAATRGDGKVGEDVTKNILTLDVPKKILETNNIEIRGEIVMLKSDFQELNKQREKNSEKLFANPRNAAAGSLRQLDANVTKSRKLKFFPYSIVSNSQLFETQFSIMKKLEEFGFMVSDKTFLCSTQNEAYEIYRGLEKRRADLEYDIDGVVYKVNDLSIQKKLGSSAKFPRHSIAYKFTAEKVETTVKNIFVQIGRTGVITPVAELLPVTVGGTVITRATLHNRGEVEKKDIRVGDRVVLHKAGDVIPQILYSLPDERNADSVPFVFPEYCLCCNSKLAAEEQKLIVKCTNFFCEAQIIERLMHFVSRDAFNIEGLGEKNIKFFYKAGIIKTPPDIFEIESRYGSNNIFGISQLEDNEGWGRQSVENLFKSINKSRSITLDKFIYSFGISQLGKTISKLIANFLHSHSNLLNFIEENRYDDLLSINGIGKSIVDDMRAFFDISNNLEILKKLAGDGRQPGLVEISGMEENKSGVFSGEIMVFTGTFEQFSRDGIKKMAEEHGAHVSSSVSNKTTLLIAGNGGGKKLAEAKKFGTTVISEDNFQKIIEKNLRS
jgi:DNA ligase (NAD+)